jgi:hypothetical protein
MAKFKHFPTDKYRNPLAYQLNGGINLLDRLLLMRSGESCILKDLYYKKDTLIKRYPFTRYSTEDWSSEAPFKGLTEYIDTDNNKRLLFATQIGKIHEYLTASSSVERVSGLTVGQDVFFSSILGRVVAVNGSDAPKVGDKTSWREFGALPAVSTLAVTPSGSGSFTGTWLHIVVPVKEIDSDTAEIYADWSNIITSIASANSQFDLTWTDVVDSRINKYWVFRTQIGVQGPFYRVARVNTGVQAYTDTTTDANLEVIKAPLSGRWGQAPTGKFCAFSGSRLAMANFSSEENAVHVTMRVNNTYDCEGFPISDHKIYIPGDGPITGIAGIGDRGNESNRTNHLFIGQLKSCYLLPETDPKQKLIEISGEIGLINNRAIVQHGSYIFWVDGRKGLVFWKIGMDAPWVITDKIKPIFLGGGNQSLTENQADSDITLSIYEDQLLITVRDDSSKNGCNKIYLMDLNSFIPDDESTARKTARFTGPWEGPGFALMLELSDKTLLSFDNENEEILHHDSTATKDYIKGESINVKPRILTGPFLNTVLSPVKHVNYFYLYHYSESVPSVQLIGEYGTTQTPVIVTPITYGFLWDDITWDDIEWLEPTWQAEGPVDWNARGKWFQLDINKDDSDIGYAFFGFALKYETFEGIVTNF